MSFLVSKAFRIRRNSRLLCILFLFVAKSLLMLVPWYDLLSVIVVFPGHIYLCFSGGGGGWWGVLCGEFFFYLWLKLFIYGSRREKPDFAVCE